MKSIIMMKSDFAIRVMAVMLCVTASSVRLYGQDTPKEKGTEGKYEWTDKSLKEAGDHLKKINEWQSAISDYEIEEAERERRHKEAQKKEEECKGLNDQLKDIQRELQNLFSARKERDWFKQMYEEYDTTMLKQVKGHMGDEQSENIVDELLACHRAEALLSKPYDDARAKTASEALTKMDKNGKAGLNSKIADRLDHYGEMTENLREVLLAAINIEVVKEFEKEPSSSSILINQAREAFFRVIEGDESGVEVKLNPSLLNPQDYPYLYKVLMKALERKLDNPGNKIDDIIEDEL